MVIILNECFINIIINTDLFIFLINALLLLLLLDDLYEFFIDVANMYHSLNPYHNFRHAIDVMQAIFYFLCQMGVIPPPMESSIIINPMTCGDYSWLKENNKMKDLIKPLDALALVLASIGHDVGHPGVNNMFMVKIKNKNKKT